MRLKITAKNMKDEVRVIGTVLTDSVNRALQMYEDDLGEDEIMYYEFID